MVGCELGSELKVVAGVPEIVGVEVGSMLTVAVEAATSPAIKRRIVWVILKM